MSRVKLYVEKLGEISYAFAEDLEVDEVQTAQLDYYLKYGDHNLF